MDTLSESLEVNESNMSYRLSEQQTQYLGLSLFWLLVFLLNIGPQWDKYGSLLEVIETAGTLTLLQAFIVIIALKALIPVFLNNKKRVPFFISIVLVTLIACEINILVRYLYLEPTYADSYKRFLELYGHMTLRERMFSLWTLKWLVFSKMPQLLYPSAILIAHNFYKQQQRLLRLSEQKRKAELDALKSQLNPHFIFNTLNNLYALTLKKSDKAPMVIEKLSDILDYVLYRCNDDFVPLASEIKLLKSYITLEKIRFGERVNINFNAEVDESYLIAPLILLTLVENACKHSSGEEIKQAFIDIELTSNDTQICFKISNSKPLKVTPSSEQGIGLANLQRQLQLIYSDQYQLSIQDDKQSYQAELIIQV